MLKTTNKKQNVNVNTYMAKSKRNNKNTLPDIQPDIIPECVIPDIIPDIIVDIKPNVKALNLMKAREARRNNLNNNINAREQKIINFVNEIKEEELLKLENKTEKLKNKLMKLI
jgi:hypothetical protein